MYWPIPMSMESKANVCTSLIAGIASWIPADDMDALLFCFLCVV